MSEDEIDRIVRRLAKQLVLDGASYKHLFEEMKLVVRNKEGILEVDKKGIAVDEKVKQRILEQYLMHFLAYKFNLGEKDFSFLIGEMVDWVNNELSPEQRQEIWEEAQVKRTKEIVYERIGRWTM